MINLESKIDLPKWNNNQIYNIELVESFDALPNNAMLLPAYPNPFNPITNISFILPIDQYIFRGNLKHVYLLSYYLQLFP